MEEQRRVQEAEIGRSSAGEGTQQNPPANTGTSSERNRSFSHYIIYFIGAGVNTAPGGNEMDVTRLTEDEQIALAIQMSMSQAESARMSASFLLFSKTFPLF
jgi:hypothetical protein